LGKRLQENVFRKTRNGSLSMAEADEVRQKEMREVVERAVAQVLADQLPHLQHELVQRVLKALPAPAAREGAGQGGAGNLLQSVASVHAGTTQKEILRALLDSGSAYCARIALFVVKAGAAT
jgi:hypothetical protein